MITKKHKSNTSQKTPTFYIETYGCQMNSYDSMIACSILSKNKAIKVSRPEEADMILLNTCAIRENAHTKIYNRLRSLEYLHRKGAKIGILGCMAQNLKKDILNQCLPIDFIIGPDSFRNIPEYLYPRENKEQEKSHLKLSKTEVYEDIVPNVDQYSNYSKNSITAFISIQRGCDNFCSFCVVPFTRGRERSRDPGSIIEEIKRLSTSGFKTVILLGQNVNSYQYEDKDFYSLVEQILNKTSIERIYFTSPHPKDFPKKLIDLMAIEPRFCNQVHVPLQSGSDEILKKMKRGYTQKEFLQIIQYIRDKVPDVCISTDIIVGFPGETEKQFKETVKVMQKASFDSAFMFAYSERKNTLAEKIYEDNIPWETKKNRLECIIEEQLQRSLNRNQGYIGKEIEIMVEGTSKRDDLQFKGSMTNGRKVIFRSDKNLQDILGKVIQRRVESANSNTLFT